MPSSSDVSESPLGNWHANLLTLQKQNCILMVHDATRFPVFIKELHKPDFAELAWHFEDALMNTLLKAGADDAQMQAAVSTLRSLQFDSDCDRSVQGALNQRAQEIEYTLVSKGLTLADIGAYGTGVWLSEMLTKIKGMKGYIRPNEEMFALLDGLAQEVVDDAKQDDTTDYDGCENVVSIDAFRR